MKRLLALLCLLPAALCAQTTYWLDSSPFTDVVGSGTKGVIDYVFTFNSTLTGHTGYGMNPGADVRFASNTASIALFLRENSQSIALYQDGVQVGSLITIPGGFSETAVTLATGLDTSKVHEYRILNVNLTTVQNSFFYNLVLDTGSIASVAHSALPVEYEYGDSRTYQEGLINQGVTDARVGHTYLTGAAAGHYEGWETDGSGQQVSIFFRDNTAEIPANAARVWLPPGINDLSNGVASATFQAAYQQMLVNARARDPAGKFVVIQPLCTPNFTQSALNTWGGFIQAAIAATGDANVFYVPTSGWITQTSAYSADGTHLTQLGEAQYANRQAPIAAPLAIVLTGPVAGAGGAASGTFTVTLAAGATFTGDQTITLSDSSGGGTFTPSVGSPGVSSVTVTPTAGLSVFTFTYTPVSGAHVFTITPTAGQAQWTMPAAPTYTTASVAGMNAGTANLP